MWLPLKPGTNVPVLSAMAHVIVKEGLVNNEFVAKRTEGYQEFVESLEKFTPEYAEELSGVPAEDIRKAARMYATAKNGAIYWGMGISQLSHGTATALALIHLAFLTGHIGRDGTGLNPLRGQNNVQGASDMGAMPFHYPGYMRVDNEDNAAKWEQTWNIEPGGLSRKLGLTTTEILGHAHEGGVRALYIMGENPMMSEPNLNETRKHMTQLEFLVAQDLFINEFRRVRGCLPARNSLRRKGWDVHQHGPPRPAGADGSTATRPVPPRLADPLRSGDSPRVPARTRCFAIRQMGLRITRGNPARDGLRQL